MIPLARKLSEMNYNVIIGSGDEHLALFRKELPGLSYISFPGFKPTYSRLLPQYLSLIFKIPALLYHIAAEHRRLKRILLEHSVDIIISDNRFGLWNKKVTSVYITHMPLVPFPRSFKFLEPIGVLLHRQIIKKYTLCFIPDLPDDVNLSGRLSHNIKLPGNVRYIGILSRFTDSDKNITDNNSKFKHNTVILSGPQPQREILKQNLIALFKDKEPITVMFEGKPGNEGEISSYGNIAFYNHLPSVPMREMIESSDLIITRAGYTTLMELVSLNLTALIIPTPGQTEQEYLAEYLSEKGWFRTITQNEIKDGILITPGKAVVHNEINRQSSILLTKALEELLEKYHK